MLKEAFGILKTASNRATPPEPTEENRKLKSFANFITEKMKKYSNQTKNIVQQEFFQTIFRADQGYYEHPQQHVAGYNQQYYYERPGMQSSVSTPPRLSAAASPVQSPENCASLSPASGPAPPSPASDYTELISNIDDFI